MKLSTLYELDSKLNSSIDSSISNTDQGGDITDEEDLDSGVENIVANHRRQADDIGVDPSNDIEDLYGKYRSQMEKISKQRLDIKSAIDRATQKQKEFSDTLTAAQQRLDQV